MVEDESDYEAKYVRETRTKYQSHGYATRYFNQYSRLSPRNLYAVFSGKREQRAVDVLLARIPEPVHRLLDIPAGTGKLTAVHRRHAYRVVGGDVSGAMLRVGRPQWQEVRGFSGLCVTDIMGTAFPDDAFDCTVCLRLMHRLPPPLVVRALSELARITRGHLVVSTGVSGVTVANLLKPKERRPAADFERELGQVGEIVGKRHVIPRVSRELVYLVRLKGA